MLLFSRNYLRLYSTKEEVNQERKKPETKIWRTTPTLERVEEILRMTATHQVWGATCPQNELSRIPDVFDCIEGEIFRCGRKFLGMI